MQKIYILILVLLAPLFILAAEPTLPATNFSTVFMQGNSFTVNFSKGNGTSRIAVMKKGSAVTARPQSGNSYLSSSTFGNGQELAPGEFVVYFSSGASFPVYSLVPDAEYHLAIFEFNGSGINTEFLTSSFLAGTASTLSKPTVQPTNFIASNITGNNVTLSWQAGDGTSRLVLAKRGGPVNANPVELTSYNANSRVGYLGVNQIGDQNFVVYKGTGNSVNLTEMYPDTSYHFAIFEFNGTNGPVYLTTNPLRGSIRTLPGPTIPASNISFYSVEANRIIFQCTPGNGSRRIVVMREEAPIEAFPQKNVDYGSNEYFDASPEIAPGHKVVYDGISSSFYVYNLSIGTSYSIGIFEYSGADSNRIYLTSQYAAITKSTLPIPSINVTNIDTSTLSAYNAQLVFTPGNGSGRLIVLKKDSLVDFVPNNFSTYNVYTTYGGTGVHNYGNGNYGVSKGVNTNVTVGLQPNTKYYVAAFEYNGIDYPVYNITDVDTFSFTTKLPPPPTNPSRNITFTNLEGNSLRVNWTKGNGDRRIVIIRKGSLVTANPENGIQYTDANKAYNLAPEIEPGQKVIYDGTGAFADIDSLEIGTQYYVKIVEYNGTGNITSYLSSEVLAGNQYTVSAPTVSSNSLNFKLLTLQILQLRWKLGNGSKCIVLARKNAPVDGIPENLKSYTASRDYGVGSKIGESYVVSGSNNYRILNDTLIAEAYRMEPGNTYYFKIFGYNGNTAPVYKQTNPEEGSFTITFEPPSPATNFRSTSSEGNSLNLQWSPGGGTKRIIIVREGQAVDAIPQDGVDYLENENFRLAAELAPGQRVVYDGTSTTMVLKGLNPSTQYFLKIFEYGGTGTDIDYLTSQYDSLEAGTKYAPTIQASNAVISAITPESGNVSWTNGNGEYRLLVAKKGSPVNIDPRDTINYGTNNYYGYGGSIGEGNYVLYKGSSSNHSMTRLEGGTTYHIAVYEMNGFTGPVLLRPPTRAQFTTLGPPKINAIVAANTEVTNNSFQINYSLGSGQKRIVVLREGNAVNAEPVDNVKYIDNSFFEAGDQLGTGNFVVYNGEDSNMVITGLKTGTTYHYSIFEYNAFSGGTIINYLRPSTATGTVTTSAVVPVSWVSFSGTLQQRIAKLKWTTGYEQNNNYFIIERSTNAIDYSEAGRMNSNGNSVNGKTYLFDDILTDEILRTTSNIYYRIKQVDQDGRSSYSPIINLQIPKQNNLLVYPNPVKKGTLPGIFIKENDEVKAQLFSASGKLLMQQNLEQGYNTLKIKKQISGLHLLKLWYADGSFKTFKILFE